MKLVSAILLTLMLSPAAHAEESYWPRDPSGAAMFNGGGVDPRILAEHKDYRLRRHARILEAGFCNAAILPVEYSTFCWNAIRGPNPTGGQVGESIQ